MVTRRTPLGFVFSCAVLLPASATQPDLDARSIARSVGALDAVPLSDGLQEGCDASQEVRLELHDQYRVNCDAVYFEVRVTNGWKVPVKIYVSAYDQKGARQAIVGGDAIRGGAQREFTGQTPCNTPLGTIKVNACWDNSNCRCTWPD